MLTSKTAQTSAGARPQLKREMGLWMAIALVIGTPVVRRVHQTTM